jgi:hypothetical protein
MPTAPRRTDRMKTCTVQSNRGKLCRNNQQLVIVHRFRETR